MLQRKQFTFYRSFFEAIETIPGKHHRADMYAMVCDYALNGNLPDIEGLTAIQKANMRIIMPILDSARQKAEAGQLGGSRTKAEFKHQESKDKDKEKMKEKEKNKTKSKGSALAEGEIDSFEIFWALFPKKVGKELARQAFKRVDVPLSTLKAAIAQQQNSIQWSRENGQYIPNPDTWLSERRWEDELPMLSGGSIQASGIMGDAERDAIRRMLAEG